MSDGLQAVVLAAGSARRFGGRKLLADWNGAPLLHAALACARAAPAEGVTVVTGADAADIAACVRAFDPAIRLVHAPDHAEGMAASLRTGIASLPADTLAAFVFLGDMPRVSPDVLAPLSLADWLACWRGGGIVFAPEAARQLHQVPVAMAAACLTIYMVCSAGGMVLGNMLMNAISGGGSAAAASATGGAFGQEAVPTSSAWTDPGAAAANTGWGGNDASSAGYDNGGGYDDATGSYDDAGGGYDDEDV